MGRASLLRHLIAASILLAATAAHAGAPTGTALLKVSGTDATAALRADADAAVRSALAQRVDDLLPQDASETKIAMARGLGLSCRGDDEGCLLKLAVLAEVRGLVGAHVVEDRGTFELKLVRIDGVQRTVVARASARIVEGTPVEEAAARAVAILVDGDAPPAPAPQPPVAVPAPPAPPPEPPAQPPPTPPVAPAVEPGPDLLVVGGTTALLAGAVVGVGAGAALLWSQVVFYDGAQPTELRRTAGAALPYAVAGAATGAVIALVGGAVLVLGLVE